MNTEIIDLELTVRIGALDATTATAVEAHATRAFLWRGRSTAEALDLARGLHWIAVGLPARPSAAELVAALAVDELDVAARDQITALLDAVDDDADDADDDGPTDPLGLDDHCVLGCRIALTLVLLDQHATADR